MPRWPYRMRLSRGRDGVLRSHGGVLERLMHVRGRPVRTRSWQTRAGYVHVRAESVEPAEVEHQVVVEEQGEAAPAGEEELGIAVERTRFSLAVLEEMGEFYDAFKRDPLLGPAIHHKPWVRPRRRPWPWEALCWAITEQLIEGSRAGEIQRRIVRRWAPSHLPPDGPAPRRGWAPMLLRDLPSRCRDRRPRAGRARLDGPEPGPFAGDGALCAGGRDGTGGPLRSRRRPPPARDPRDRPLDRPVPRLPRARRPRLAARRGPRLREAGRLPGGPWPPRHRRGGR